MADLFTVVKDIGEFSGKPSRFYLMKDGKTWTSRYSPLVGRWKQETAALKAMSVVLSKQESADGWLVKILRY